MLKNITPNKKRWASVLAVSLATVSLVACDPGLPFAPNPSGPAKAGAPGAPVYTMIFDAGSSGTRISFFKVIPGAYPKIELLASEDFDDNGINDFLSGQGTVDPKDWERSLPPAYKPAGCDMTGTSVNGGQKDVGPCVIQPLLDAMDKKMKEISVTADQVTVELFATAGMRTMDKVNGGAYDATQIAGFYNAIKDYTKSKGYQVGSFETSNGNKQEGVWTWVNLNDQYYNAFGGNDIYHKTAPETRGDFEVGGSSMQIAFPTSTPASDANNVYTVSINGHTYNVFSKTYLGLGGDDARKYVRASGYNTSAGADYTGVDCFGSNATPTNSKEDSGVALFNSPALFPSGQTPAGNATGTTWAPVLSNAEQPLMLKSAGKYNFNSCATKYDQVTKAVMALPRNNNGTNNEGTPSSYKDLVAKVEKSTAPFVGLDGFYFSAKDLKLVNADPKPPVLKTPITEAQVKEAIAKVCPDNGAGPAAKKAPGRINDFRVCADSVYMYNFLWQGTAANALGLFGSSNNAKFDGVVPSKWEGKTTLTWTRGYLLLKHATK